MRVLLLQRHADAAIAAQQYDAAISDFETLLGMSPKHPRLLLGMGMAMVGKGDTQKALPLFDQLIASSPSAAVAYYGRGAALYRAWQAE